MGHAVVGVLMGVGMLMLVAVATDVIVIDMHNKCSFSFFSLL
jgi:hypothetical protein